MTSFVGVGLQVSQVSINRIDVKAFFEVLHIQNCALESISSLVLVPRTVKNFFCYVRWSAFQNLMRLIIFHNLFWFSSVLLNWNLTILKVLSFPLPTVVSNMERDEGFLKSRLISVSSKSGKRFSNNFSSG